MTDSEVKEVLADWLDQRVMIEGILERVNDQAHRDGKSFKVALVQEIVVTLPNKARYELSHNWVQRAESLVGIDPGTKIRCSVRVRQYTRKTGEKAVGFSYPVDVAIVKPVAFCAMQAPETIPSKMTSPSPPPALATPSPLELLLQTNEVVARFGGAAAVSAFLASVASLGGWDAVSEVETMAQRLGGIDDAQKLLAMLK
jgi:hypothetical protein